MYMQAAVQAIVPDGPISARFVRILPTAFHGHCSLRADVLLSVDAGHETPVKPPSIVVLGNFSEDDPFELQQVAPATPSTTMLEEQHLALLQAKLSSVPPELQRQVHNLQGARRYEDPALQRQALDDIPVCELDGRVGGSQQAEGYELSFMRQLLRWFKHEFFTWTNTPKCEQCSSTDTKNVGTTSPTPVEQHYGAGIVEVAHCQTCGSQTRFPRYNDPSKLLETRSGRCGEWANCFTLVCRALGYEARHVHDWTDHVWTEVYSGSLHRWVHLDACEAALDTPLVYEQGWGKKLTYCLAFARDHVVDVTRRYTRKFDTEVLPRRVNFSEQQLQKVVAAISEFATERSLITLPSSVAVQRRATLARRAEDEAKELLGEEGLTSQALKAEEQVGRTSGDAKWREQRGELGATAAAQEQALERSTKGLDGADGKDSTAAQAKQGPGDHRGSTTEGSATPEVVDVQAQLRARFAEHVAAGLSPNEAALLVLEEARKR